MHYLENYHGHEFWSILYAINVADMHNTFFLHNYMHVDIEHNIRVSEWYQILPAGLGLSRLTT